MTHPLLRFPAVPSVLCHLEDFVPCQHGLSEVLPLWSEIWYLTKALHQLNAAAQALLASHSLHVQAGQMVCTVALTIPVMSHQSVNHGTTT